MPPHPYPVIRDGVLYVPQPAVSADGLSLGDGYVRLDSLPEAERRRWEEYVGTNPEALGETPDAAAARRNGGRPAAAGAGAPAAPADVTNVRPISTAAAAGSAPAAGQPPASADQVAQLRAEVEHLRAALERIAALPDLSVLGAVRRMAQAALNGEPLGAPGAEP